MSKCLKPIHTDYWEQAIAKMGKKWKICPYFLSLPRIYYILDMNLDKLFDCRPIWTSWKIFKFLSVISLRAIFILNSLMIQINLTNCLSFQLIWWKWLRNTKWCSKNVSSRHKITVSKLKVTSSVDEHNSFSLFTRASLTWVQ